MMPAIAIESRKAIENYGILLELVKHVLKPMDTAALIGYERMLTDAEFVEDRMFKGKNYLGLINAPAAIKNHHAYQGGLVSHYLEMWDVWRFLRDKYRLEFEGMITDSRVLCGIINHDLSKAYRTFVLTSADPWATIYGDGTYGNDYQFMDDSWKSREILARYEIPMDAIQTNCLIWAHGGFSESQPKTCTALAKLVYLLDEFSGNVLEKVRTGCVFGHRSNPVKPGTLEEI